jgi:N-acetylneuraminate synthase
MPLPTIKIGKQTVGEGHPCYIIGEIGINHNGDIELAKKLILLGKAAGCDAVKFQKRTPEICVPPAQRNVMRETPWGYITYMEYREKVELNKEQYQEIDRVCRDVGITWFASCWDAPSVDFIRQFDVPCYKIASAALTDDDLLRKNRETGKPLLLSTGMSTIPEIEHAVKVLGSDDLLLMHTVSTYPAYYNELNLRVIGTLREHFKLPIGYSGHETGLASTVAAVAMGACSVERHITLDRSMWGSDHAASLEPSGLTKLCRDIRLVETAMGTAEKRVIEREKPIIARLRLKS